MTQDTARLFGFPIRLSIILATALSGASVAMAQQAHGDAPAAAPRTADPGTDSPPPPIVDAPTPDSPAAAGADAPAAPLASPSRDINARLDEVDQIARITVRKQELIEEETVKRAAETPATKFDDQGLSVKSGDGAYLLRIRGLLQTDGRFFLNDDVLQDKDTFLIRRFRPATEGTLFGFVDYRFVPDFAGGTAQVLDAYVDVHPSAWLRLRAGKFKAPIGLERLQSDADLPFVERALDQNLSTTRDVGAQIWGEVAGGVVNYVIGIVNGGPDGSNADLDTNHAKDYIGRLFFQPFKANGLGYLGNLGVGVAGSTGNRKGLPAVGTTAAAPGLPTFRTAGQNAFFSYVASSPDASGTGTTFAHLRQSRLNPQLYYFVGPVGVLGEYILSRQGVQKGNDTATLTHQAAHVSASFALNGKEGWDGITPLIPFDSSNGAWGALEISVRWSWLKVDSDTFVPPPGTTVAYADPLKQARSAQAWTFGLNYVPRRSFRLALDLEQTRFKGGAAGANKAVADRVTEYALIGRAQVNF